MASLRSTDKQKRLSIKIHKNETIKNKIGKAISLIKRGIIMNRNEFFNTLFANLPQYTKEEQDEIRTYYDELISDGIEAGLDEAEVISKLDTPENIAHSLNVEYGKVVNVAKIQSPDAGTDLLAEQPENTLKQEVSQEANIQATNTQTTNKTADNNMADKQSSTGYIVRDNQSSSDYTSTQPIHNIVLSARNRGFQ